MSISFFAENNSGLPVATGSGLMPSASSHSFEASASNVLTNKDTHSMRVSIDDVVAELMNIEVPATAQAVNVEEVRELVQQEGRIRRLCMEIKHHGSYIKQFCLKGNYCGRQSLKVEDQSANAIYAHENVCRRIKQLGPDNTYRHFNLIKGQTSHVTNMDLRSLTDKNAKMYFQLLQNACFDEMETLRNIKLLEREIRECEIAIERDELQREAFELVVLNNLQAINNFISEFMLYFATIVCGAIGLHILEQLRFVFRWITWTGLIYFITLGLCNLLKRYVIFTVQRIADFFTAYFLFALCICGSNFQNVPTHVFVVITACIFLLQFLARPRVAADAFQAIRRIMWIVYHRSNIPHDYYRVQMESNDMPNFNFDHGNNSIHLYGTNYWYNWMEYGKPIWDFIAVIGWLCGHWIGLPILAFLCFVGSLIVAPIAYAVGISNTWNTTREAIIVAGLATNYVAETTVGVMDMYAQWKFILNNLDSPEADKKKLEIINFKSICHILYYAYKGDKMTAAGWASNFLFTSPQKCFTMISALTAPIKRFTTTDRVEFVIGGRTYYCPAAVKERSQSAYTLRGEVIYPPDEYLHKVETEALDAIGMMSTLFGLFKINNMTDYDIRQANQNFNYINNLKRTGCDTINFLTSLASTVCRYFHFDPFNPTWQLYVVQVLKMIDRMDHVVAYTPDQRVREVVIEEIIELYKEASVIRLDTRMDEIGKAIPNAFNARFKQLEDMNTAAKAQKFAANKRRTPTVIALFGAGGSGKTGSGELIATLDTQARYRKYQMQCLLNNIEEDPNFPKVFSEELAWHVNSTDKFASGYAGQFYTFIDEMFSTKDMDTNREEAMRFLHMVNGAPYPLNMAEIEQKGNTFFKSQTIIVTSNTNVENFDQFNFYCDLHSEEALKRRFHILAKRDDPAERDAKDNVFEIMACSLFPEYVGKFLTTPQLYLLLEKVRARQDVLAKDYEYSVADIDKMLDEADLLDVMVPELEPIIQVEHLKAKAIPLTNDASENAAYILTESCRHKLYTWYDETDNANYYITLLTLLCMLPLMYSMYTAFYPTPGLFENAIADAVTPVETEAKGGHTEYKKGLRSGKPRIRKVQIGPHPDWVPATTESNDDSYYYQLETKISKTMVYVVAGAFTGDQKIDESACVGFHLRDRKFVVPDHFYHRFANYKNVTYVMIFGSTKLVFKGPLKAYRKPQVDLVIFELPLENSNVPPSLWKYLDDNPELEVDPGYPMSLITIDSRGATDIRPSNKTSGPPKIVYGDIPNLFVVESPILHHVHTVRGDSGAIICIRGPNDRPIAKAMHVATFDYNNKHTCIALPISKHFFENFEKKKITVECLDFPHEVLREVPFKQAAFYPTRNKFRKTMFHGCFGPETFKPTHLAPFEDEEGNTIRPYEIAAKKLTQGEATKVDWDPEEILELYRYWYPRRLLSGGYVATLDEAVNGVPGRFTSINVGTSMGYPWTLQYKNGKRSVIMFNLETQKYDIDPDFRILIEAMHVKLRDGVQIECYITDGLKPELRPIEKVDAGKTRLFGVGPIQHTIFMRMYCQDFFDYMQESCVTSPVAIGINAASTQWTQLFLRLSETNESVLSGDFSNYDGSVPADCIKLVCTYINEWYADGPTNARVRELLFEHIYNPTRICGTKVYKIMNGVPSGVGGTAPINSLAQMGMAHTVLTKDLGISLKNYSSTIYGDDGVYTLNKAGIKCSDLAPHFLRRFNMTYTDWRKTETDVYDTLYSIRYLGRMFVPEGPIMKCPLDMRVVKEIPYYTQMDGSDEQAIIAFTDSFYRECFQFGRPFYEEHSDFYKYVVEKSKLPKAVKDVVQKAALPYHDYWYQCYVEESFVPQEYFAVQCESRNEVSQNSGAGNFDKVVNMSTPNQTLELGDMAHDAPLEETAVGSQMMQLPYRGFNLPSFNFKEMLEREYQIGNTTWTTGSGAGTLLQSFDFPDVLLIQPFIVNLLNNFKWMKFGIEITINVNASPYLYGLLQMIFLGNRNHLPGGTGYVANTSIGSGFPNVVISATAGESVVFRIPFIHKARALEIHNYNPGEAGTVLVQVLNALRDTSGGTNSANYLITARFTDTEVYGPVCYNCNDDEIPMEFFHEVVMESKQSAAIVVHPSKEATKKGEEGVISKSLDSLASMAARLSYVPTIAPYANIFSVGARTVSSGLKMAGLSKPNSVEVGQLTHTNPFATFNDTRGIETARKLGLDPENSVTTEPICGGIPTDEMDLSYVVSTPQMVVTTTVTFTGTGQKVIIDAPDVYANCYCDNVRSLFKYWCGVRKYCLVINASNFHSITAVVWFNPESTTTNTRWQNCYHKIFDIKGTTIIDFEIPYTNSKFMEIQNNNTTQIFMTLLNWAQPNAAYPIDINVYKAMGSDALFGCYLDCIWTTESNDDSNYFDVQVEFNPREHFQGTFASFHPGITGFTHSKLIMGETVTSFRELLHRMHPYSEFDTLDDWYTYNRIGHFHTTANVFSGIEMIGKMYMYFRGSITMKVLMGDNNNTVTQTLYFHDNNAHVMAGMDATSLEKPELALTVPHFYADVMKACHTDAGSTINQNTMRGVFTGLSACYGWKAAGDDFSFAFLIPLPSGSRYSRLLSSEVICGYPGYSVFLNIAQAPALTNKMRPSPMIKNGDQSSDEEYILSLAEELEANNTKSALKSSRFSGRVKKV